MALHSRVNGRYDLGERLGQGGMGVVYKAYDSHRQGYVALKTMKDAADQAALELFAQEWRTLANISHPNIIDVLDSGKYEEDGQSKPYFVMPLLPGSTLDKLIRNAGKDLTVPRVVEILCQTCRGLQAAHTNGLIHRDLKPSNLFVLADDSVKIIDFGMVHLVDVRHSVTGIKGTLQYMAPEQLEMKDITPATDIFSLGVVAYEALTGRKPFDRGNEGATAQAIRNEFPPPIYEANPAVNKILSQVIAKAMAKGPWNRFTSAREFGDHLHRALVGETIDTFDPIRIQPRVERARKALNDGDFEYAQEVLNELQSEGHVETSILELLDEVKSATRARAIRLLLESARTRLQAEEYPLAWQKVQEALQRDPGNKEAQALQVEIETRRSDQQIDKWRRLVQQHLHNQAFTQARQAIEEIRKLTPNNVVVADLTAETDRREKQYKSTCAEKEQHYQSAMKAYDGGEISTALSKLEKILEIDNRSPAFVIPGRDEVYRETYNRLRSEWEAARIAVGEIENIIGSGDIVRAAEVCEQHSLKYPTDFNLQALKLKIEELQRQEKSAYIADTIGKVEAEPDWDRSVKLLEAALHKYPQETHLQELLAGLQRRRDFVDAIVAKARQSEEQGLYAEALSQWKTLRGIHARYPGLDFEIERVQRSHQQQKTTEARQRWVSQIDRLLEASDYDRAYEISVQALDEFEADPELQKLQKVALDGRARNKQAVELTHNAEALCGNQRFTEAIGLLRRAFELDPNNLVLRSGLADALAEHARTLIGSDWRAADPLIQEALRLSPENVLAKSLRPSVLVAQRMEYIDQCVAQTRDLQASGNVVGALAKVQEGLATYPNDARLVQLQTSLKNSASDQFHRRRTRDLNEVRSLSRQAEQAEDQTSLTALLERSRVLSEAYPEDEDFSSVISDIEKRLDSDLPPTKRFPSSLGKGPGTPPPPKKAKPKAADARPAGAALDGLRRQWKSLRDKLWKPLRDYVVTQLWPNTLTAAAAMQEAVASVWARIRDRSYKDSYKRSRIGRMSNLRKLGFAMLPIVLMFGVIFIIVKINEETPPKPPAPTEVAITLTTNVSGATVLVDGQPASSSTVKMAPGSHSLKATLAGYKPVDRQVNVGTEPLSVNLELLPEPCTLRVLADAAGARVLLDDAEIGALQEGAFSYELAAWGPHTLKLTDGRSEIFSLRFEAQPGQPPKVLASPSSRDLSVVAVSNLGTRAFVHSSLREMRAGLTAEELQTLPSEGREFTLASTNTELTVDDGKRPMSLPVELGNAPVLMVRAGGPTKGNLVVEANLDGATVFVNGVKTRQVTQRGKWMAQLAPGDYRVRVALPGYEDTAEQVVKITLGKSAPVKFELTPAITTAFLRVEGGTPDAELVIDGNAAGKLDANGSFLAIPVSPDTDHKIRVQKADHESVELTRRTTVKQTIVLSGQDAHLRPFGTLVLEVQPAEAEITLQRQGEAPRKISGRTINVPQGTYTVHGSANQYDPASKPAQVTSGQRSTVSIALARKAEPAAPPTPVRIDVTDLFDNGRNWQRDSNGFWMHEGESWFKNRYFTYSFDVLLRKKRIGHEKARWVIYLRGEDRVDCELDDSKFSRREVIDGVASPWVRINHLVKNGTSYPVTITVAEDRVAHKVGAAIDTVNRKVEGRTGFYGKVGLRLK